MALPTLPKLSGTQRAPATMLGALPPSAFEPVKKKKLETMKFPVGAEGLEFLREKGLTTGATVPPGLSMGIGAALNRMEYERESDRQKEKYKQVVKKLNPKRYWELLAFAPILSGTSEEQANKMFDIVNASETERWAFTPSLQFVPPITGMKFVTPQQAATIIARAGKVKLVRQDLIDITTGKITKGAKFDTFKAMVGDPAMRKEISAIAKNKAIPKNTKIADYVRNLLKSTKAPAKPLQIPTTGKELVAQAPKIVPKLAPLAKDIVPKIVKPAVKKPIPPTKPPGEVKQMVGEPIEDPIKVLNKSLKESQPLRGKIETQFSAERAKRIAKVERVMGETENMGAEEGYAKILSQLKGELISPEAKIKFEPIKNKLTEEQLKVLYIKTWKHPYLDNWEKIRAAEGLTRLLGGEIPQAKQLVLLEEVYGSELIRNILRKRGLGMKAKDFLVELANLPRALLATADMSAFLRQGIIEVVAHPKISAKAIGKTFKFAFSPKAFNQWFKDVKSDPLYSLMRKSGLAITDPSKAGMVEREEAFISRFLQKTPIVRVPIEFAERAYVGFLNKLRVDIFKVWSDELLSKGFSPVKDSQLFKSVANVVNTFTGRGSIGKLNKITPELNIAFFSPRLISARFNAMNPWWYYKMPKEIRMKAISDFAKFVGVGLTTLALIKLWDKDDEIDVETNPRSSDFGKIRIGDTRWDIWGGFQQWARVFAQLITGERKVTTTGEIVSLNKDEYPFTTREDVLSNFIKGKLAPVPALLNELISGGKTFEGEDLTLQSVAKEKFIPMYIQDITDAYESGGIMRAVGAGIPAFFGIGVQTWTKRKKKKSGLPSGLPKLPKLPSLKLK